MKYQCEICKGIADDMLSMQEHEKQCRRRYEHLLYCKDQLDILIHEAEALLFGIVVEVQVIESTETDNNTPKSKLRYFPLSAIEIDTKKNRCVIKVKNDDDQKTADKSSAEGKDKPNKKQS